MPVPRGDVRMIDCISRFETELRRAVWEIAMAVLAQEMARRTAAERADRGSRADRARKAKPGRRAAARANGARSARASAAQMAIAFEAPAPSAPSNGANGASDGAAHVGSPGAEAAAPSSGDAGEAPKKGRPAWTRDRVVEELANWLIQDPVIDAATLSRRNQSSLVAAARRLFGRFDAALNAANLHLAELYPDGPPKRGRMPAAA